MPELPEVETTIRGLKPIVNSTILNIKIHTPKLRIFIPKNILLIKRVKIQNIKRIGKLIIIHLENSYSIVFHLGMSERIRLYRHDHYIKQKHDHFIAKTNNGYYFVLNDSRRFGFVDFEKTSIVFKRRYISNLGKDALSVSFSGVYLFSKINKSLVPIKQILLNQSIIAGIGNIYASEILFDAKISPLILGKNLKLENCNKIVYSCRKILRKAINAGGSTLRDYISSDGTLGNFQSNFKVYGKENKKVAGKIIKKIVQYGRSTYYCPELQKKKKKS